MSTKVQPAVANSHTQVLSFDGISTDRVCAVHGLNKAANVESVISRSAEKQLCDYLAGPTHFLIALHGSSKQGKSTILRNVFPNKFQALILELGHDPSREQIYRNILAKARASVRSKSKQGLGVKVKTKLGFKIFGAKAEAGMEEEAHKSIENEFIKGDDIDIDYVGDRLKSATPIRVIVLDNFHHVSDECQKQFARDFASLGGKGFKVVIAGTWKQADYLVSHNTDLAEYYRNVSIDPWSIEELEEVVRVGAHALKFQMPAAALRVLAAGAQGSIWALQNITQRFYLDQIAKETAYAKASNAAKANIAAQRVSSERVKEIAERLVRVSDFGAKDETGRSQVSFVTAAILASSPDEMEAGFSEVSLKKKVDTLATEWARRHKKKVALMDAAEFAKKIKQD
jgi:hypothetical protein